MGMHHASAPSAPGSVPTSVSPPLHRDTPWLPGARLGSRLRATARTRPALTPLPWKADDGLGYEPTHPYVREYWIPIIGPGAVADMLRLAAAAQRGRPLKMPTHLGILVREGVAERRADGAVRIRTTIPPLTPAQVRRLPPRLRRLHATQPHTAGRPAV